MANGSMQYAWLSGTTYDSRVQMLRSIWWNIVVACQGSPDSSIIVYRVYGRVLYILPYLSFNGDEPSLLYPRPLQGVHVMWSWILL